VGFSQTSLDFFIHLGRDGHIPRGARVLEFGSQNIYGPLDPTAVQQFLDLFMGSARYSDDIAAHDVKVEVLLRSAGFEYLAFDFFHHGRTIKFDLNQQSLPREQHGHFDVVTNLGTTEHVANQYNAFKVAHDALRVGGIMINDVPFFGSVDHSLVNYHPKFFTSLADNNEYDVLHFGFSDIYESESMSYFRNVDQASNGANWNNKHVGCALMRVIFRKTKDAEFFPPTDISIKDGAPVPCPTVNEILARPRREIQMSSNRGAFRASVRRAMRTTEREARNGLGTAYREAFYFIRRIPRIPAKIRRILRGG
jgi:hypothetical protein